VSKLPVASIITTSILLAGFFTVISRLDRVSHQVEVYEIELAELKGQILELQQEVQRLGTAVSYRSHEVLKISARERECLTKNIFYEAGVEDHAGKIAVAQVTLNRLRDGRWGNDMCKVVYARSQFSWTSKPVKEPHGPLWQASILAADRFIHGERIKHLEHSMHYHADYVKPFWAKPEKQVHRVGQHVFYAMK
jgi:spore germination cell wall hydrolase CwlJ-like protein